MRHLHCNIVLQRRRVNCKALIELSILLSMCEVAGTENFNRYDRYHVTMTSTSDVTESLDYVINIDSSPFTRALSTGNVTIFSRSTLAFAGY